MLFCLVFLGFIPRIATERMDSHENRLEKIVDLIIDSKYSIHDLSRCQARVEGEYYRLNMPFELGIDYGCASFKGGMHSRKRILILEQEFYRYQASISDLAGCDIQVHEANFQIAIRKVRNWLVSEAGANSPGAQEIYSQYTDFQEWYYKRQLAAGFSQDDIMDYPTIELLDAMKTWVADIYKV